MQDITTFVRVWLHHGIELNRRGDPLLMGSAIAFNSLFALVPLGIAFVSIAGLLEVSSALGDNIIEILERTLPPEIAAFIVDLLLESSGMIAGDRILVAAISILVALWSGSRAVYAIQKSLRLVQGEVDERGYIRTRLVGITVTVAAIIAVFVGYTALTIGENAWEELSDVFRFGSVPLTRSLLAVLVFLWVFGMLWAVYRFGPPRPIEYSGIVAGAVATVLFVGTGLITFLLPKFDSQAVAVFGSLGVILLWLYFIGVVVVAFPIAAISFRSARVSLREE